MSTRIRDWWERLVSSSEARAARERAHRSLEVAQRRAPITRGVARNLREDGVTNHFAELIRASMRGS